MRRTIGVVLFPRFQILDATGPIAAFEVGGRLAERPYVIRLFAREPGLVASTAGVALPAEPLSAAEGLDTLLVAGGDGVRAAAEDAVVTDFLRQQARQVRRIA